MPPILRLRADGVLPHLPRGGAAICRTATRKIRKGIIDPIMRKSDKRLTLILLMLCLASAAVYGGARWYISREGDSSCPVISFDKDIIEVSVSDPDEKLLRGVSAYDKKDGDVSGSLVIESRSALLGGSERIVTYAAFDSDNNVGKGQRRIRYTDYVSPRLSLDAPLTVTSSSTPAAELVAKIHADDCIDGDISDEIVVLSSKEEITVGDAQLRILEIQVTNSCGDIVFCRIPSARGERYILHRISRITDDGFYMIGDAQNVCEGPFPESCVFGVAVSVVRRGKTVTPESLVWKFYSGPWLRHAALRRAALRLRKGPLRRRGCGKGDKPSGSAEETL